METLRNRARTRGAVLFLTAGLAVAACSSGHDQKSARSSELDGVAVAHRAGFANATRRDADTADVLVQFGACLIPGAANRDDTVAIMLGEYESNYGGDNSDSRLGVEPNTQFNLGAVKNGAAKQIGAILNRTTHDELLAMTEAGLTGLENCLLTGDQINQKLAEITTQLRAQTETR